MVQLIATPLQFNQNNSFSTTIQLNYNYTYDVILTSLIVIPFIKIWHIALWRFLDIKKNRNIDLRHPLRLLMVVQDCDMWHKKKLPHGILIVFWKYLFIYLFK
jgi:hypothetical protein